MGYTRDTMGYEPYTLYRTESMGGLTVNKHGFYQQQRSYSGHIIEIMGIYI